MAFTWSEKTINWYAAAVAFTGFGQFADVLTNFLQRMRRSATWGANRLSGAGAGIPGLQGYAIDKDTRAIGWLRNELQRRGISYWEVVERDWLSLRDRPSGIIL